MKREIKFRVWDKLDKEMTLFDRIRILPGEKNFYQLFEEDRYIWMQYTGLTDKNEKEIYDGDIITDGSSFGFVFYNEDSVQFQVDFAPYDDCPQEMSRDYNWMEVAGNIYENSELLK